MTSTITREQNELLVTLAGDLTGGAEAMRFAKLIREAITTASGLKTVVIDMKDVGFVDSSGLGMLLGAREAAESVSAKLALVSPNAQFLHLLELTKLTEVLGVRK